MKTVVLNYFKPSGKFYSEGTYKTNATHLANACEEVRLMMLEKRLPDLMSGHSNFHVHVEFDGVPALLLATPE